MSPCPESEQDRHEQEPEEITHDLFYRPHDTPAKLRRPHTAACSPPTPRDLMSSRLSGGSSAGPLRWRHHVVLGPGSTSELHAIGAGLAAPGPS